MQAFLEEAKKSSRTIANLSTAVKNRVLNEMADALMNHCDFIISNNEKDMSQATLYNLDEALKWEVKAALQGDPEAQYDVGLSYEIKEDYKKAMEWYLKASDQNYGVAQLYIGMLYANGKGVSRDVDTAIAWYRKAAENGNESAQMTLDTIESK